VRALPLAAGINVVAIVLGIIFLSLSLWSLLFYQKEASYGFEILHGFLSNKNIRIPTKSFGDPKPPAHVRRKTFAHADGGTVKRA
jgi:hypothetical protein